MTEGTQPRPTEADWKLLQEQIAQANRGCRQSLAWLRDFLDRNPQVWAHIGDLARTAEAAWIGLIANGDQLLAESLKRQLQHLKSELLGEQVTVPEKMVVDTVLATWLECHHLRAVDADSRSRTAGQTNLLLKRLESAQRRHFAALKQLAALRKLIPGQSELPGLRIFSTGQESA